MGGRKTHDIVNHLNRAMTATRGSRRRHLAMLMAVALTVLVTWVDSESSNAQQRISIATWNVFYGDLDRNPRLDPYYHQPPLPTVSGRVVNLVNFGRQHGIQIIALQEMPRDILAGLHPNPPAASALIYNAIVDAHPPANQGAVPYQFITVPNEYPPHPPNPWGAASQTTYGYLILYKGDVVQLIGDQWNFFQSQAFGLPSGSQRPYTQARPPVEMTFQFQRGNLANPRFGFLTWHNEAGAQAFTAPLVGVAYARLLQQQQWIIAGDLNVVDGYAIPTNPNFTIAGLGTRSLSHDNQLLDHIITSAQVCNPATPGGRTCVPGNMTFGVTPQQWGEFWSDSHYILFGIITFQ
jgi:hypothetical protein